MNQSLRLTSTLDATSGPCVRTALNAQNDAFKIVDNNNNANYRQFLLSKQVDWYKNNTPYSKLLITFTK